MDLSPGKMSICTHTMEYCGDNFWSSLNLLESMKSPQICTFYERLGRGQGWFASGQRPLGFLYEQSFLQRRSQNRAMGRSGNGVLYSWEKDLGFLHPNRSHQPASQPPAITDPWRESSCGEGLRTKFGLGDLGNVLLQKGGPIPTGHPDLRCYIYRGKDL